MFSGVAEKGGGVGGSGGKGLVGPPGDEWDVREYRESNIILADADDVGMLLYEDW